MRMASHALHQFKLHKKDADDRRWDKFTTDDLEQALCLRLTTLRCNLVVLAHVDHKDTDEFAGSILKMPALPGRLARSDALASRYPERYTIRLTRDEKDKSKILRVLQTRPDARFHTDSVQIKAPEEILLTDNDQGYRELWTNYDLKHAPAGGS
jgi:hypothetical protein